MKKIKKKLLTWMLALAMCLGMCQGYAMTAQAEGAATWLVAPGVYRYYSVNYPKFSEGLMLVEQGGKWGYINTAGQLAIPCQYDTFISYYDASFQDGVAKMGDDRNYAFINAAGQILFSGTYQQDIRVGFEVKFHEGLLKVRSDATGKFGFMNMAGQVVLPCQYDDVRDFSDGLAAVYDAANAYWGYIDAAGNVAIPFQYKKVWSFVDGYAPVQLADGTDQWILIDKAGRNVIPEGYQYDPSENIFSNLGGFVRISKKDGYNRNEWFLLDKAGKVTGPLKKSGKGYDDDFLAPFSTGQEGLFWLCQVGYSSSRSALIDATGRVLWDNKELLRVYDFSEGYAVILGDTSGFVDQTGKLTLLPEGLKLHLDTQRKFSESFMPVSSSATGTTRYGFVNTAGQLAIPCTYKDVGEFSGGVAPVKNFADKWGLVDATGAEVLPLQYDEVKQVKGVTGVYLVKEGQNYGLVAAPASHAANGAVVSYAAKAEVDSAVNAGIATEALGIDYRNEITREQLAATAVKLYEAASGQPAPAVGATPFVDVDNVAVTQAKTLELIDGLPDGQFVPKATVPREQAAAILSGVSAKLNGTVPAEQAAKFDSEGSTRKTASIEETLATAARILKKIKK